MSAAYGDACKSFEYQVYSRVVHVKSMYAPITSKRVAVRLESVMRLVYQRGSEKRGTSNTIKRRVYLWHSL